MQCEMTQLSHMQQENCKWGVQIEREKLKDAGKWQRETSMCIRKSIHPKGNKEVNVLQAA